MSKKTLVIGASPHPHRYAFVAVKQLTGKGHDVIPLGIEAGKIGELDIQTEAKDFKDVDTVTLYIRPEHQKEYHDYILNVIKPKRIIFNPGTENPELMKAARANSIEALRACTLVMLSSEQY